MISWRKLSLQAFDKPSTTPFNHEAKSTALSVRGCLMPLKDRNNMCVFCKRQLSEPIESKRLFKDTSFKSQSVFNPSPHMMANISLGNSGCIGYGWSNNNIAVFDLWFYGR